MNEKYADYIKQEKLIKAVAEFGKAGYDLDDSLIDETMEYIERDYAQISVHVLEKLLDVHPEIWEIINSLE